MANNDNNPRRGPQGPEDNPFIAFRRFADNQASSIFNTVFTIPSAIAGFKHVHQARRECLFGKADERKCDELYDLESQVIARRRRAKHMWRTGDHQALAKNDEELAGLYRQANELRRDILGLPPMTESEKELVQRVGNQKGQEWGWSHSWGWPIPFDEKADASRMAERSDALQNTRKKDFLQQLEADFKNLMGDKADEEAVEAIMSFFHQGDVRQGAKARASHAAEEDTRGECQRPRTWGWSGSWRFPPPADSLRSEDAYSPRALENSPELKKAGVQWRGAHQDLQRAEQNEGTDGSKYRNWRRGHCSRHRHWGPVEHDFTKPTAQQQLPQADEPSYEYSHDHEDQHDDPPTPKVGQGQTAQSLQTPKEEDDQLARQDQELQQSLERQRQAKQQFWDMWGHDGQQGARSWEAHQQDDSTELDVYEQLLAPKEESPQPPAGIQPMNGTKPSILSTITTTERTIAPDGSVTTKVMLKKRFTDGREESSETVHTQRGQEDSPRLQDPWKAIREAEPIETKKEAKPIAKKGGWFWSS